jgi:hypothetical protein
MPCFLSQLRTTTRDNDLAPPITIASVGAIQRRVDGLCAFGVDVATRTVKATGRVIAQRNAASRKQKGGDVGKAEEVLVRWEPVVELPPPVTTQAGERIWPDQWISRADVPGGTGGASEATLDRDLTLPRRTFAALLRFASGNHSTEQRHG